MEIKLVSVKKNPLLNRKEVDFLVEQKTKTPSRLEIKKSIADELKVSEEIVFVKKMRTLTGSNITVGIANIYDSIKHADLIESDHIKKRNQPQEIKKKERKGVYVLYKIEKDKISRLRPTCERCGAGYFMANHKDRYTCGHCGFTRYKQIKK
jgi:ribosomal protein S24E